MEPISLIVSALATGAAQAAGELIPDGYKGLKALIQRKFSGQPGAEMALQGYEQDPGTFEEPLKKKLEEAGVAQDPEIVKAAQQILGESSGKLADKIGAVAQDNSFINITALGLQARQEAEGSSNTISSPKTLFGALHGTVTITGDIVGPIEDAGWDLLP